MTKQIPSAKQIHISYLLTNLNYYEQRTATLTKLLKETMQNKEKEFSKLIELNPFVKIIATFNEVIKKVHPQAHQSITIQKRIQELYTNPYTTMEELTEAISQVLFRVFFSEGATKIFDFFDENHYDDRMCQKLFDKGVYFPKEWLEQFIICLIKKSPSEDMRLHKLTPDTLWHKCFDLIMELCHHTKQSIKKNEHNG